MSAWGPAEEVDEGVERHGADWQGIKEPYQLALNPRAGAGAHVYGYYAHLSHLSRDSRPTGALKPVRCVMNRVL